MTKKLASDISKLILNQAKIEIPNIQRWGHAHPGTNGPYADIESPVRNTSHWLLTFLWCFSQTGDNIYQKLVNICCQYLLSNTVRPLGYTFLCRSTAGKDHCSGLIGQAWVIEALATAGDLMKFPPATRLAKKVFHMHAFDITQALWFRREINGKKLSIDSTLNHQIWFAAAGSLLQDQNIDSQILIFLDHLEDNITLFDNGVIFHPITRVYADQTEFSFSKWLFSGFKQKVINTELQKKKLENKSYGYHIFALYGLAQLHKSYPNHNFWGSEKFAKLKNVIFTEHFVSLAAVNKYGIPYNPIGFEFPWVIKSFFPRSITINQSVKYWYDLQLLNTFNKYTKRFDRNNPDPNTLTARIYELTRGL